MNVELVTKTVGVGRYSNLNNAEVIAAVARHGTIKDDNGKLVKYLMDKAHWSPLQHVSFGFLIQTSRAISAQIFRHRSLNFQETSQRYQQILEFEDVEIRKEHPTNRQSSTEEFDPIVSNSGSTKASEEIQLVKCIIESSYRGLLNAGVAKECARMILPMCSSTTIHVTGTLRDLLSFLNVRCDHHAQKEVRDIANEMGKCLEYEMPEIMGAIDWRNGMFL